MEFKTTVFEGLIEVFPRIFHDSRGFFFETYNRQVFETNGIPFDFVQDNHSYSQKGVVRGLHFQYPPFGQGKLVRVISGKVMDIVVDIRKNSPTFGQHTQFLLEANRGNMVYVPVGFAHGFVALEDSHFAYKCTGIYDKASEGGIIWNDIDLNIDWQVEKPIVSEKDILLPRFKDITYF